MNTAAALETAKPINGVRSSAEYRKAMVKTLMKRAVSDVWGVIGKR
jgi:CO/xanthine dehydrogenase FAD-binding subunit